LKIVLDVPLSQQESHTACPPDSLTEDQLEYQKEYLVRGCYADLGSIGCRDSDKEGIKCRCRGKQDVQNVIPGQPVTGAF
jgi:hypothetical protein